MSANTPNTPRPRRRIAGERKGQRSVPAEATEHVPAPPAPAPPLSFMKSRETAASGPAVGNASAAETEAAPPPRPVPWPVMAGLAVLAAVLLVVAAGPFVEGMGWKDYRQVSAQSQIDQARRTAPAAAERAAEAILAYDYETLEADRDAAAAFMTADYRTQYLDTFDGLVLEAAVERKAHVEADVRASGVALAGEDRVEVLLFVNQVTTSTANSGEEQTALNRVMFAMVREGDTWRVDDITSY